MCPLCYTTFALLSLGAMSTGTSLVIVLKKRRKGGSSHVNKQNRTS